MKARVSLQGLNPKPDYLLSVMAGRHSGVPMGCVNVQFEGTPPCGWRAKQLWGYIDDPDIPVGVVFRLIPDGPGYARPELVGEATINTGGQRMTGLVFEGVVVKTTQVAAGVGLTSSVPKSEIVLVVPPFVAKDAVNAQAVMLSAAKDAGHALDDPTEALEAKVRQFA